MVAGAVPICAMSSFIASRCARYAAACAAEARANSTSFKFRMILLLTRLISASSRAAPLMFPAAAAWSRSLRSSVMVLLYEASSVRSRFVSVRTAGRPNLRIDCIGTATLAPAASVAIARLTVPRPPRAGTSSKRRNSSRCPVRVSRMKSPALMGSPALRSTDADTSASSVRNISFSVASAAALYASVCATHFRRSASVSSATTLRPCAIFACEDATFLAASSAVSRAALVRAAVFPASIASMSIAGPTLPPWAPTAPTSPDASFTSRERLS